MASTLEVCSHMLPDMQQNAAETMALGGSRANRYVLLAERRGADEESKRADRCERPWDREGNKEPAVRFEPTACCLGKDGCGVRSRPAVMTQQDRERLDGLLVAVEAQRHPPEAVSLPAESSRESLVEVAMGSDPFAHNGHHRSSQNGASSSRSRL